MQDDPTSSPSPDSALVLRASAGDRDAFDKLVGHYRPVLLAMAFLRTRETFAAEDLVQDILARIWQKLPGIRNPALFQAWIKTIPANVCSTWYRQHPSETTSLDTESSYHLLADAAPKPLERVLTAETQRELHRTLLQLPSANRLALLMHVWGDYSYAEIAMFTEVPVTTVEGRIYRAKCQMRRLLREDATILLTIRPCHQPGETERKLDCERTDHE